MGPRFRASTLALLAPATLLFAVFVLYPIGANLWLSLYAWDGVNDRVWVGLANYRELFADPAFGVAVANNLRWVVAYLAVPPALGLVFALLLMRALPGAGIVRSLFFMPFVISQVVVGLVFTWFFHARFGLWGRIAGPLGLPAAPLDTEAGAIWALIVAGAWPQTAYCMILYLAGLAALPTTPSCSAPRT